MNCESCGYELAGHKHHIRPKEHGGADDESNLVSLCPNCHAVAHALLRLALRDGSRELYDLYRKEYLLMRISAARGVVPKRSWWSRIVLRLRIRLE